MQNQNIASEKSKPPFNIDVSKYWIRSSLMYFLTMVFGFNIINSKSLFSVILFLVGVICTYLLKYVRGFNFHHDRVILSLYFVIPSLFIILAYFVNQVNFLGTHFDNPDLFLAFYILIFPIYFFIVLPILHTHYSKSIVKTQTKKKLFSIIDVILFEILNMIILIIVINII